MVQYNMIEKIFCMYDLQFWAINEQFMIGIDCDDSARPYNY